MTALLDHLLLLPPGLAYGLIGVLVFAEAAVFVGFVLPGETAVLLGGVLASTGRLSLPVLLVLVVLAAVGGDSVGYEVGRRFGPRLLGSRLLRRHRARVDDASAVLRRRGGWAVLLARSTAFLRAVMPGLAGLSRMPYRRFLAFNAAGGLLWGTGVVLLGDAAGSSYGHVEKLLGRGSATLLALLVAGAALALHRHRRRPGTAELTSRPGTAAGSGSR